MKMAKEIVVTLLVLSCVAIFLLLQVVIVMYAPALLMMWFISNAVYL
jgi:hypothetical protein